MTLDEARLTLKELRYYPSLDDFDVQAVNVGIKSIEKVAALEEQCKKQKKTIENIKLVVEFLQEYIIKEVET